MPPYPYKRSSSLDAPLQWETTYEKLCAPVAADLEDTCVVRRFRTRMPDSLNKRDSRVTRKLPRDPAEKNLRFLADPFAREKGPKRRKTSYCDQTL